MFYVVLYLGAIVSANLVVSYFGPSASVYTAFAFIGMDLTTLDHLHDAWHRKGLWWKMGILIATGSLISWMLNRNAGQIGIASFVSFAISAVVDRVIYAWLSKMDKSDRITLSNLGSGLTDSVMFPLLAFGLPLDPSIVFGQFTAKLAGGAFWALVLKYVRVNA